MQISAGWLLSSLAVKVVEGGYPEDRKIFGWHPLNPSPSAAAIAGATAAATGVPAAAPALLPRQSAPPKGASQHMWLLALPTPTARVSCKACNLHSEEHHNAR